MDTESRTNFSHNAYGRLEVTSPEVRQDDKESLQAKKPGECIVQAQVTSRCFQEHRRSVYHGYPSQSELMLPLRVTKTVTEAGMG